MCIPRNAAQCIDTNLHPKHVLQIGSHADIVHTDGIANTEELGTPLPPPCDLDNASPEVEAL
eukprot:5698301-Amphidinium_carterae.1